MSARKIAETQTADPNPNESLNVIAHFVKHPADLAIDSLAQDHVQPRRLDRKDLFQTRSLAVQDDASKQLRRKRCIPWPINGDLVFLFDFVTRVSEALGEIAVVCEDEESFALRVEAADIEEPRQMRR